ncbi:MAG: dihydrofolate reductase [Lachnospiraceae bacterium]|nr:dihydrofolate reductase [Lachnospiraceae bacterium]
MKVIVAVDSNWAIGNKGALLARNKEDMQFFKTTTTGNVVVMGRKTLESFPGGRPLKDRDNIVITSNASYSVDGAYIVSSVDEAVAKAKELALSDKEVYVIGGASIYEQMLDICDEALVTKMNKAYEADAFFPNLDESGDWELYSSSEDKEYPDGTFNFCIYKHK